MHYDSLLQLCDNNEAFYHRDLEKFGRKYRVFNYRLASYSDFADNPPHSLECRGILFDITEDPTLVSLPMEKFFNLYENPFTEEINPNDLDYAMEKRDGSLISTYYVLPYDGFALKSKASLESEQAIAADAYLEANVELKSMVYQILQEWECTVNFEWTAPDNRIVVPYQERELIILNVRSHDGSYIDFDTIVNLVGKEIEKYWVGTLYINSPKEFIEAIPSLGSNEDEPVVEGFVLRMKDGRQIKVKTERYMRLHRTKDDITNPKRLFECVINEQTDDLRSLFHYDNYLMELISEMEKVVEPKWNHMVDTVEKFYAENKTLERKEYAVKGQSEVKEYFSLVMPMYIGKDVDYKKFAMKNIKSFIGDYDNG